MSAHVVIGAGVAGQHHMRVLRMLGHSVRLLDISQPDFARARQVVLELAKGNEIWHICTPTCTHLDYVKSLVAAMPQPRIILEKPIGRPGESEAFRCFAKHADIVVQSQYDYAVVVEALGRLAGKRVQAGSLSLCIDFRKKRAVGGRFVDSDRHALGYEGFHQLAIGLRLIETLRDVATAQAFASTARLSLHRCDDVGFDIELEADGIQMKLSSLLDSEQRSAHVMLNFNGRLLTLVFETCAWRTDQPRQLHSIRDQEKEFLIEEDLMLSGVLACVRTLERQDLAGIARNQARALEIEGLLDRAFDIARNPTMLDSSMPTHARIDGQSFSA